MKATGSLVAVLVATLGMGALAGCDLATGDAAKAPGVSAPPSGSPTAPATGDANQPSPEDEADIRAVMDKRAEAVLDGDARAFKATVDPRQPKLVAAQMTLFHNLEALPIESFTYNVSTVYLVPAPVPGHDPVLHPQMLEQLQLKSTMVHTLANKLDVTLVKRGRHWLVGAERKPGAKGAVEEAQERPWFGAPIAVAHEGRLTVLIDKAHEDRLADLVDAVQEGVQRDADILGVDPDDQVLVDATSNGRAESFGAGVKAEVGAVTFPMISGVLPGFGGDDREVAGTAIKINPTDVLELLDNDRLIWHELTHYLLIGHLAASPVWLTEGVAAWAEWQPTRMSGLEIDAALYDRAQSGAHELPDDSSFYGKPDVDYLIGQAAVQWLVDRDGIDRLRELLKAYDSLLKGAGHTDVGANTGKALRRVYDISEKELAAGTWSTLATLHH